MAGPRGSKALGNLIELSPTHLCASNYSFELRESCVNTEQNETNTSELVEEQKSPDDLLAYAQKILYENLRSELIDKLKSVDSYNFERIVTTVMEKMNYGVGTVTPKSHDDGIDGIIDEDELGFISMLFKVLKSIDAMVKLL